jgi:hypothetical protein
MIVLDPLFDHLFGLFGNVELFGPAVVTSGQDKAGVFFAFLTFTIWFATSLLSKGGSGSDKLLPRDIRFELRAAFSFELCHGRTTHVGFSYLLYIRYKRLRGKSSIFYECESAQGEIFRLFQAISG